MGLLLPVLDQVCLRHCPGSPKAILAGRPTADPIQLASDLGRGSLADRAGLGRRPDPAGASWRGSPHYGVGNTQPP